VKRTYSTGQAAKMIGVGRVTLQRWLIGGRVAEPKKLTTGGVEVRIWTDRDVERLRRFKEENYRKGRGRKPKPKTGKRAREMSNC
jgi:MerR HTH family regulatory protein